MAASQSKAVGGGEAQPLLWGCPPMSSKKSCPARFFFQPTGKHRCPSSPEPLLKHLSSCWPGLPFSRHRTFISASSLVHRRLSASWNADLTSPVLPRAACRWVLPAGSVGVGEFVPPRLLQPSIRAESQLEHLMLRAHLAQAEPVAEGPISTNGLADARPRGCTGSSASRIDHADSHQPGRQLL